MPGDPRPSVCNRKRLPRREQLKHSSTRRNPFRKIQNSPLRGSDSWIFLSQDLVFAAQAAPAPCADCLLVTDQPECVRYCSGAMTPGSASATAFRSARKSRGSHQLPAAPCGHAIEAECAWPRTAGIICLRTICTSPWCNFRCGEARCAENIR